MPDDPKSKWTSENAMDRTAGNTTPPSYPNEAMVKIFSSARYSKLFSLLAPGQRVLDVGCGFGNNLTYFVDRGLEAFGVEVTDDMIRSASDNLKRLGRTATIVRGDNEHVPFPDEHFDVLISTAAIHYSQGADALVRSLTEFKRVTKTGGRLFITTAGPSHEMRAKTRRHGPFRWEVLDYGFRTHDLFAFFDDRRHLGEVLTGFFPEVETGSLLEAYATRTLEFLYALCVK